MEFKRNLLAKYKNGNYIVYLYDDGTKIRKNNLTELIPEFPESFDLKITNYCEMNCPMCHEMSNINGKHSDIMNEKFIETIHPGTEVAIGGGMVTSHPDLENFLIKLKNLRIFPSITVHQEEYKKNEEFIQSLIDRKLIYGIGVSIKTLDYDLFERIIRNPNVVIHTIAGYTSLGIFDYLRDINAKILILGFKNWGRGEIYLEEHPEIKQSIKDLENDLFNSGKKQFKVLSFDNLALAQLNVKNHVSDKIWNLFYQKEDGYATMYIDAVERKYALNSTSQKRYNIEDLSIDEMFNNIKLK